MISSDSCKCLTISLSSLRLKRCLCWFSLSISWVEWPQKHMYLAKLQLLRKLHSLKGRFSENGKLTFQSILRLPNSLDEFLLDAVGRLNLIRNDNLKSYWKSACDQRQLYTPSGCWAANIASKSKETELGSWPPPRRPTLIIESSSSISCSKWSYVKHPKLNVV